LYRFLPILLLVQAQEKSQPMRLDTEAAQILTLSAQVQPQLTQEMANVEKENEEKDRQRLL
jgi:hypothetical protein